MEFTLKELGNVCLKRLRSFIQNLGISLITIYQQP